MVSLAANNASSSTARLSISESYDIRKWKWKRQLFCPSWSSNWIVSLVAALIGLAQFTFPGKAKDSESCFFLFWTNRANNLFVVVTGRYPPPAPLPPHQWTFFVKKKMIEKWKWPPIRAFPLEIMFSPLLNGFGANPPKYGLIPSLDFTRRPHLSTA